MSDSASELSRIVNAANKRERYQAKTEFPKAIVEFARRVEQWFMENGQEITLGRFRATFITLGEGKLGFEGYITKIVPHVHTLAEFENLMAKLGYEFDSVDERAPVWLMVTGDTRGDDRHQRVITNIIKQLPEESVLVECGGKGVEAIVATVADQYDIQVNEYQAHKPSKMADVFMDEEPYGLLIIHENPKHSARMVALAKLAKQFSVPIKVIRDIDSKPDLYDWLEEISVSDEEDEDDD